MTTAKKSWFKRGLSAVLAATMVLSMNAVSVFAQDDGTTAAADYSKTQSESSVMSLTAGEDTYYFDDVASAFAAVDNTEAITGDVTLKVLKDTEYEFGTSDKAILQLFQSATGSVTLDLNSFDLNLISLKEKSYGTINIYSPSFTLTDSACTTSKAVVNGKENASFEAGSLGLTNAYINYQGTGTLIVKNIKGSASGEKSSRFLSTSKATSFEISNVYITRDNASTASQDLFYFSNADVTGTVADSVMKNNNGGIFQSKGGTLKNNVMESNGGSRGVIIASSKGQITVDNGSYIATEPSYVIYASGTVNVKGGVFTGKLKTASDSAVINISGGYYKGEWEQTKGSISTSGTKSEVISGGDYDGYTKYTLLNQHTSTVQVVDEEGNPTTTASVSATANGESVSDLSTVYAANEMVYTITCKPDYEVKKITYTPSGETEQKSAGSSTYTMTVPDKDYTLTFIVGETDAVKAGDDIVSIGGTKYKSLTTAMLELKDNDTLKLEKDVTYTEGLEFNKNNVTLDLNGKTLTMDVQAQSGNLGKAYGILVSGGSLTIQDETGKGAVSSHKNDISGIRVEGTGTVLNLTGGTYKDLSPLGSAYSVVLDGTNTKINFSGGTIKGRISAGGNNSQLNISDNAVLETDNIGMAISVFSLSTSLGVCDVNMTGGRIYSSEASTTGSELGVINLVNGKFEMTGGTITGEGTIPVIYKQSDSEKVSIGDSAEISSDNIVMWVQGSMSEVDSEVTIDNNAKLKAVKEVLEIEEEERFPYLPKITINGGYFACEEDSIPISNTAYVTFPEGKVLNTKTETEGEYAGYYTLEEKTKLGGTYTPSEGTGLKPVDYTYQDFDGISDGSNQGLNQVVELAKETYEAGNGEEKYPSESWNTFTAAYDAAVAVKENANANQMEINYRTKNLSAAYLALQAAADLDVNNLADGTYKIGVGMWKSDMTTPSMSGGAVDPTAILTIKDGKASLELTFGPTYQYTVYGHLMDFFMYQGENRSEAYNYMKMGEEAADAQGGRKEATYANWYKGNSTSDSMIFRKDIDGIDEYSEEYNLPHTVRIDLPYLGTNDDLRAYWVGMTVDAMGGYAAAILMLNWSSLEEVDVQPTLSVSAEELSMMVGEEQTVTATLKGEVSEGYTVTKWESSNSSVATVDSNGKITAKGEGTATITVTATKSGEKDLTKTIAVTVAPEGSESVKVEKVDVSGNTETATLTGNFLTSGSTDGITVNGNTITVDAKADASGITSSKVVIPQETAKALLGKTVVVETNTGSITLDSALLAQIASVNGGVTLSIAEAAVPDKSLGSFSSAYELSLTNASGDKVEFGEGKATVTVVSEDAVSYAYCIENGSRTERVSTSTSGDEVSFTVSHFSTWALSANEYEAGGASTGFFLEDGNYYVDIDLWKTDSNEASMGNVAFKNNDKALITVKDGKITKVQIGTNPVDIDPYHSAIIKFELADGTEVKIEATGDLTTVPANKDYTYIKLVSFNLPDSAQPDIKDAVTYVPVNFYVPDTPMDAAVGETLTARLRFAWSTATKTDDTSLKVDDTTAAGDSDITGEEIVDVNLEDKATGIKLETNSGILSDKAQLSVSKLTQGADYDIAKKAMNGVDGDWSLYKITTLVDGVETAPLGSVLLYIPCGADGLTVYRVNADGTKTLVKGEVQDGYYVIRTTSLGLFAMVGETTGTPGGNDNQGNNGNTTSPQTGDTSNVGSIALLALAAAGMMGVTLVSRKRKSRES